MLKYLFTSTRGRTFGFARLDHRQTRQDMQWWRGGPVRCCGPGCWCGELRDMGMGRLPGGSYILPRQGVPQEQLPCSASHKVQGSRRGVGCKPSQDTATLAAPSPASLSALQPPPTLCRGQQGLCEDPAAEQQQAAPMCSVPALHSGSASLSSNTNGLN